MSHGGMGGGGHGHGGHGGHHGHHGAMAGHHADQSPAWNMAFQTERDMGRRLRISDPRVICGVTLFVFVSLLSLPYTLDYFQNQHYSSQTGNTAAESSHPDSSGPSAGALSMVGATLFGGGVHLPEAMTETTAPAPQQEEKKPVDLSEDSVENEVAESARQEVNDAPQVASESAQNTISQMVAASGISPARHRNPYALAAQQPGMVPGQCALPYAPPQPNQPLGLYIPNQQFGQPAAVPAAVIMPGQFQAAPNPQAAYIPTPQRQSIDPRSPFNPQTSAIVSPMGMRRHPGDVPMMPAGAGMDGAQRFRVVVSR